MKIARNNLIRSSEILLLLVCLAFPVAAQNALERFEKSVNEGNFAAVEKDLFGYVVANPQDAGGFYLLAKLRLKQKRPAEARSLAQKALALDPKLLSAKLNLAEAYFQLGETEQSRSILNSISISEVAGSAAQLDLAQMLARAGDCPQALAWTEKLPLKIKNDEALALRGDCYLKTNDRENFDALIPTAKLLAKQNPKTAVEFAEVLSRVGKHKETVELLRPLADSPTKNFRALALLAKSEIFLKDLTSAKTHLAQAGKLNSDSPEFLFVKALLENELGNTKEALELLEKSAAGDANNIQILGQLVVTALRAYHPAKAVRAAVKLLEIEPDNLDFLYLFGAASLQNNDLSQAETALAKFLDARPTDPQACVAMGLTWAAQTDKLEQAREQMRKCLAMDANNYEAAYQLGLSYKAIGNTAKAIQYFEETVRLAPDYAVALRDLGTVYMQAGAEGKARSVLEKAVLLNPKDAETHFQMSRFYNLVGERELAKKHFDIFQKLKNPEKTGM